ncbi:MAG: OmpA family protein [Gammaproteobacteria bacterium]|nr:OmpA family protein [Gammaproteobacteria bacterium]
MMFRSSLVVLLGLAVAACTTTNPYTGEKEASNTSSGAAIGALAGAIIGAATGDDAEERRKRALIGAGVGALSGGSAGYYMDRQEAKLREQLEGTGVSVTREGDNIILNMPGNITFQTDSDDLDADFLEVIESVSLVLKEYDKTVLKIAGHTDSRGSDSYNQQLSEERAKAVATALANDGVNPERMIVVGYGEARPIATNETAEGRQANRRVELTLEPITK